MAANTTATPAITFTLSGTTADTVDLTSDPEWVLLINHDATVAAWWRNDGTVAVAEAAGCRMIPPGYGTALVQFNGTVPISVVGSGNKITAQYDPGPR